MREDESKAKLESAATVAAAMKRSEATLTSFVRGLEGLAQLVDREGGLEFILILSALTGWGVIEWRATDGE